MLLSPGARLGTYEIVGPLGAGGMGEVYRAKDLRLRREVAVKVLPAEVASSPDRLARFEREARTVAGLNHPNIVTLFSVEDEDGIRFLTMELVDGQTLSDLVTPGGLPLSRILDLSIPLTNALVAAHEKGVVHRDLKPGNVMITRDNRIKVLDFGLAKPVRGDPESDSETTSIDEVAPVSGARGLMGTLSYMSPEQIRGETVDARSDLFALGIILYELSTGRRPFTGGSFFEVSSSILRDTPEPLTRLRADLPGEFERIVGRCLERDPGRRFQGAIDLLNELRVIRRVLERGESQKPPLDKVASVAVLPFVNRSRDEADEYFSDGLADEILNVLSKLRGLRVVARTSSFQFRGRDEDITTIGRKLNVATVLEGSVRKAGNRIRVSVQLIQVADSSHLWSESYDRTLDDIFAVQDDIAHSVVKELRTTLMGEDADSGASEQAKAEVAQAAKGRATNPEAFRLYLQARNFADRYTREVVAKGIGYLKQALDLDPEFALAWAELGGAYAREGNLSGAPMEEWLGRARGAVERALSLVPDLAEGHAQMAWIRMYYDWDWRGAEASVRRALELAPGNALALRRAGALALNQGRIEKAIRLSRSSLEQDPLSLASCHNLGAALHAADRLVEAEEAYRKALDLAPHRINTCALLSLTLLAQGRGEEALAEAMREPDEAFRLWALGIIHHVLGRRAESDQALRELTEKYAEDSACQVAEVHGARGEADAAFEWLERSYAQRDGGLPEMKVNPRFRSLHGDPRWGRFLMKMGLEPSDAADPPHSPR
jgi:eukaryotic-like serine/threonine-protein kinase